MTIGRQWIDLSLFLTALSFGGYLASTSNRPTSSELEARRDNVLPAFSERSVQSINISSQEAGTEISLRRDLASDDLSRYFLGKKGTMLADPTPVGEVLRVLSHSVYLRSWLTKNAPTDEIDFSSPRLILRVHAGARSYRVLVAGDAPSPKGAVYLRVSGTNVEERSGVVDGHFLTELTRSEQMFRARLLFPYSRSRSSRLTINHKGSATSLISDGLGFMVESDEVDGKYRADRAMSDLVFFQLARAKIGKFLDAAQIEAALESSNAERFHIVMESPDGPPIEVELGGQCPGEKTQVVGRRINSEEVAGCVPGGILAAIRAAQSRLRSHSVVPLNSDEIDHVVVERGDSRLDLIREGAEFRLGNEKRRKVHNTSAEEFLSVLTKSKFKIIDSPPARLLPQGTITIKGQSTRSLDPLNPKNDKLEAVRKFSLEIFGTAEAEELLIKRHDDGVWLQSPEWLRWAFSGDDAWTRPRALSKWKSDDIVDVVLSRETGNIKLSVEPNRISLEKDGVLSRADPQLSRQLFDELSHLEALRYLSPSRPRPKSGLSTVHLNLRASKSRKSSRETLWIGARTRGGYLAWSTFTKGTFVLPLASQALFETPFIDRSPLVLDTSSIRKLEVAFEGRRYNFKRSAASLTPSGGDASFDMVDALEDALSALRISSALPTGTVPAPRRVTTLSLRGIQLNGDGAPEDFIMHFGGPISFQGQALISCWREGYPEVFGVTQASFQGLTALL